MIQILTTPNTTDDTNATHRVWFMGVPHYFTSLLPAMEYRKELAITGVRVEEYVSVEQFTPPTGWTHFDAAAFLADLERLFAPVE
jgi:hypothetical protein